MRRGALYTYALENGYKKLALAHHLDDAAEVSCSRTMEPFVQCLLFIKHKMDSMSFVP